MGWFESSPESGLFIGDDALDATHDFLKELAALYEEGCGRKPVLAEVVALLRIGLSVSGSDYIADLEERAVTDVTVKTAKRPKKQSYKVGDVFAIPLDKELFAFGRITYQGKARDIMVEVFRATSSTKHFQPFVIESGRLFGPLRMAGGGDCLAPWRWIVVKSDESYKMPPEDETVQFATTHAIGEWCSVNMRNEIVKRWLTEDERKRLEDGKFWNPADIEERIRKELQVEVH